MGKDDSVSSNDKAKSFLLHMDKEEKDDDEDSSLSTFGSYSIARFSINISGKDKHETDELGILIDISLKNISRFEEPTRTLFLTSHTILFDLQIN